MKAYALIAPFQEKFSTTAQVKAIKAANITDFTDLPWQYHDLYKQTVDNVLGTLTLKSGEALYLYGGRNAIVKALDPVDRAFVQPPGGEVNCFIQGTMDRC